jgi:hypothetical protein
MGANVVPTGGWRIHNYKIPEPIIMGFEYEIQHRKDQNTKEFIERILPKHYSYAYEFLDYRGKCGYEIKSSVAPLRTLKSEVERIYPLLELGPLSAQESRGGIHINISRTRYTNRYYEQVFSFLHNINNYLFLFKLSNRSPEHFDENCRQQPLYPSNYLGIITTRKSYAFELRMFGAQPDLLVPALEFAHALFDLASQVNTLTIDNVKNHIKRWKRYSHIHNLITDLNL